jgi:hypothetical protein
MTQRTPTLIFGQLCDLTNSDSGKVECNFLKGVLLMRRISGLVLAASFLLPVSFARADEVTQIYTNNLFADAFSTDPSTGNTIGISASRVKGKGAPVDTLFVIVSTPSGFATIQGTLPKNALHITANAASLEVDIADLTDVANNGFPAQGVISVDWHGTGVARISGNSKEQHGNVTATLVGTATSSDADVEGSFFGTDLIDPSGRLSLVHTSLHIHFSTN